ncbi:ComEC/Rec2 family competence protein [Aestuariivivens marinum]|uniref:ComEC/Rec2 family competence protein n=1 Tax=Aestuariivivens marinum TaxID=2913555 RepID=UPI001F560FFB|nr:ComEC/Rec2 family competence protein [Aestuariivivens marinum]
MRLLNFTIIKLTFCLIIGIIIGYYFTIGHKILIYSIFFLLLVLFFLLLKNNKTFKRSIWFGAFSYLTLITLGVFTVHSHNQKQFYSHYSHYLNKSNDSLTRITFSVREVLKPTNYYDKYVVNILDVNGKDAVGKVLLNLKKDSLNPYLKVDQVYKSHTQLKEVPSPLNPNQFNYKSYLEKQYIYHQIQIDNEWLFNTCNKHHTIFGLADSIRSHINSKLKNYNLPSNELAIINALLLGQRQDISEAIYTNYTNAGAIHILAVSGLHVGIILLILSFLLQPLEQFKHGKLIKMILLISLLWGFAIIAGLSASVTRAVTMFSVVAIAANLKRPTNIYNTLAISMFIILLFKPLFLFDVGFQLSYLAVCGIVTIDPILYKLYQSKYWLVDKLWHTLTVTISAQLGIIPISLFYFHQFPSLFFISNLIIIPVLGLILAMGILVIGLAVANILPVPMINFYVNIIRSMNHFVEWISEKKEFLITDIPFNELYVVASYVLIITIVRYLIKPSYYTLRFVLIGVLFMQLSVIATSYNKPNNQFIVFQKYRHTIIGNVKQNHIKIAYDLNIEEPILENSIKNYVVGNHINSVELDSFQPVYLLNKKTLLVIDSIGAYKVKSFKPDYILLRQSPKVNLNRVIDSVRPKQIIVDGSNYKSYIEQWKVICNKRKLPFHNTNEMGAYIIDY